MAARALVPGALFQRPPAHQLVESGVFLVEQHETGLVEPAEEVVSGNLVELLVFDAVHRET
jgi:hypothetical protein